MHKHQFTRSRPDAKVETCVCGRFQHTEHAGPAIVEQRPSWTAGCERVGRQTTHYIKMPGIGSAYLTRGVGATDEQVREACRKMSATPELLEAAFAALVLCNSLASDTIAYDGKNDFSVGAKLRAAIQKAERG